MTLSFTKLVMSVLYFKFLLEISSSTLTQNEEWRNLSRTRLLNLSVFQSMIPLLLSIYSPNLKGVRRGVAGALRPGVAISDLKCKAKAIV